MLKPGEIIKLKGLTLHGKNRIREHGEEWIVLEDADIGVTFRSHPRGTPICSVQTNEWRWLDNKNFQIVKELKGDI
tara:strand:- start:707 stop:934 length:228 start_codon:yes stop_codon:yes gene_type:complete